MLNELEKIIKDKTTVKIYYHTPLYPNDLPIVIGIITGYDGHMISFLDVELDHDVNKRYERTTFLPLSSINRIEKTDSYDL